MKKRWWTGCCGAAAGVMLWLAGCCCTPSPVGTDWTLKPDSLAGTSAEWTRPEREITLELLPEGRVAGCAGVNRYFGTATLDAESGALKFGPLGCTMMAGPGLEYETLYLRTLDQVDRWELRDGRLLLKQGDRTVLEFEAR